MRLRVLFSLMLLTALISFVAGAVLLLTYAIEDHPRATTKIEFTTNDIARAKFLMEKYDPRNLREREISSLIISNREANILLSYTIDRLRRSNPVFPHSTPIACEINMLSKTAELLFTIGLPETFLGTYLNLGIHFNETNEMPRIHQISIGQISLSGQWMKPVLYLGEKLIQRLGFNQELALLLRVLKGVHFQPNELTLVYEWQLEVAQKLTEKGRSILISDQDRDSLIAYYNQIAKTSRTINTKETSLIYFTKPVFDLALQRGEKNGRPRAENRAAILALAMFVNNRNITQLIGSSPVKGMTQPKEVITTLSGRTDLPKHFLISAALTVLANSELSDLVGLFKEIDDSMGGSGFSFIDLLADRAGVRFAELGISGDQQAREVQLKMARGSRESEFMPNILGLKEGLMQKTFKQRYRDMDSVAFRAEKQEIERRIDDCLLFKAK